MKHVVILNMGDGDEIEVVRICDDPIEAIAYAKTAAKECAKSFFDDMHSDWKTDHIEGEEPVLETAVEKFYVDDRGSDYTFTVKLEGIMHEWIVHPV